MAIPSQKIITQDNVSIDVAAVAYFKIMDPYKAVVEVENYIVLESNITNYFEKCCLTSSISMRYSRKNPKSTPKKRDHR